MKKNLFVLSLVMFALHGMIFSNIVNQQTAETVALNFFRIQASVASGISLNATLNYIKTESDGTVDFYVYNISPVTGFVIVSAQDNSIPVLGYSTHDRFSANATDVGVSDWMKGTAGKIQYAVTNNLQASPHIQNLWSSYQRGINPASASRSAVIGPLVTTHWDQGTNYNQLCPWDAGMGQRSVTGCVATTMAQIMRYWNYPNRGTGTHNYSSPYGNLAANFNYNYDWAHMPGTSPSTTSPIDTLMYHCGVSVNMNYSPTGSGAQVIGGWGASAQDSYTSYFHYDPNTIQGVYMSSYSASDWMSLMKSELNAGRVVQYIGDDATVGGHTWVCDGYDNNNMLHMNWGWGGADDGYYAVTNLNAGGANFIQNESALIGIQPLYPFTLALAASQTQLCQGGVSTLSAQGPASATYTWTPSTGLSCTSCTTPIANPSATTLYTVTVDSNGVRATQSIAISVTPRASASYTAVPLPGCTMPEVVSFTNNSTSATSYRWDFGDGTSATTAAASHTYHTQGLYTVKLYASNTCGVDSFAGSQTLAVTGGAPFAADQNICPGSAASLSALTAGAISWFDASVTNTLANTGAFTTPPLTATTTYYVSADMSFPALATGAAANTIGNGNYTTNITPRGIKFNATTDQTLVSADVYSNTAGRRTFILKDNTGAIVDSTSLNVSAGGRQTVNLNFPFTAGSSYTLTQSGTTGLYYNTAGASYPYRTADGTVSIVGASDNTNNYYYFYNVKFQQAPCTTPLTPVTVYVLNAGGSTFTTSGHGSQTVSFTPSDQVATSYAWDFGDGQTSSLMSPAHTYGSAGTYSVSLIVSNGTCSETITKAISTDASGIAELSTFSALSVSPVPAKDRLTISFESDKQINDCHFTISNLIGQVEIATDLNLTVGGNKFEFDVSKLATGVYFLHLQNGKDIVTRKFVKSAE